MRKKIMNSNQICSVLELTLRHILSVTEDLGRYMPWFVWTCFFVFFLHPDQFWLLYSSSILSILPIKIFPVRYSVVVLGLKPMILTFISYYLMCGYDMKFHELFPLNCTVPHPTASNTYCVQIILTPVWSHIYSTIVTQPLLIFHFTCYQAEFLFVCWIE